MIDSLNIPANWEMKQVAEIGKVKGGKRLPKGDLYATEKTKHAYVRVTDFENGSVNVSRVKYLNEKTQAAIKNYTISKNDVYISIAGTIGVTGTIPETLDGANLTENAAKITSLNGVDNKYLSLFLSSKLGQTQIQSHTIATTQPKLSLFRIEKIKVPLPPIATQQQIVSKIDELFSEIDKGVEELKTAQQQLKVYRQAVLKWAFEGKLTNEDMQDGELPEGWRLVKTKDVIDIINNGYTPTKEFLSEGTGEVPFIKVYNLNFDGSLNFAKNPTFIPAAIHQKELKRSICLPGDVLINIVGPPLGKLSIVTNQYPEWNINQAIVMFRPNDKVVSKYLSYFLQNPVTINWLEGTSKATAGQWNVKVSTCREIPFPICTVDEQQQIVQELESRLSVCDKIEETITNSLKQAEALRQSILKKAFEGKLI